MVKISPAGVAGHFRSMTRCEAHKHSHSPDRRIASHSHGCGDFTFRKLSAHPRRTCVRVRVCVRARACVNARATCTHFARDMCIKIDSARMPASERICFQFLLFFCFFICSAVRVVLTQSHYTRARTLRARLIVMLHTSTCVVFVQLL